MADSLHRLKGIQDNGIIAIKSDLLGRIHKTRLSQNGFIKEVCKGWYIACPPNETKGDTTSWLTNYWDFCSQFLEERFGEKWIISPEESLLLHAGDTAVPKQLIVRSPDANNTTITFPHNTSLFQLRADLPPQEAIAQKEGIRLFTLPAALVFASRSTYAQNKIDARTALPSYRMLLRYCHYFSLEGIA